MMIKSSLKRASKLACAGIFVGLLSACTVSIDGNNYVDQSPKFSLEQFFDGDIKAWGIVQNRSGKIVQRFVVDINATTNGQQLILDERFTYSLGEGAEKRVWKITKNEDGTYTGNAGDIAGAATGTPYGNAFNFAYEMDLPVDDTTYRVNFDDWFWAMDENTMMNRSYIRKFGLVMAEVTIFMQKQN